MKKKMIPLDLYGRGLMFFVGTPDELRNEFADDSEALYRIEDLFHSGFEFKAVTINLGTDVLIYAQEMPSMETIVHECFHAANQIMSIIGADHVENDEPCAYLTSHIFSKITCEDASQ